MPESPLRSSFCPRGLGEDSPEAARSRTRKEKPRHRGPCGHVLVARPRAASPQGAHLRGRLSPSLSYPKFLQNLSKRGKRGTRRGAVASHELKILSARDSHPDPNFWAGRPEPLQIWLGLAGTVAAHPTAQGGALLLPVTQKSPSHPAWRARGARDAFASRDGGGEVLIPSGIPQGSSPAESLVPIF